MKIVFDTQPRQPQNPYVRALAFEDADVAPVRAALISAISHETLLAEQIRSQQPAWRDLVNYPPQVPSATAHEQQAHAYHVAQMALMLMGVREIAGEGTEQIHDGIVLGLGMLAEQGKNLQDTLSRIEVVY
jgi:hypothetical protein